MANNRPLSVHFDTGESVRCQSPEAQEKTTLKKKVTCKRCLRLMSGQKSTFNHRAFEPRRYL